MPYKSLAQEHLMQAAKHGADFPMAKKVRNSMSTKQLDEFTHGPSDVPEHVFKGDSSSAMHMNRKTFQAHGMNEADATRQSIQTAKKSTSRHKNLGKWLHPKKGS